MLNYTDDVGSWQGGFLSVCSDTARGETITDSRRSRNPEITTAYKFGCCEQSVCDQLENCKSLKYADRLHFGSLNFPQNHKESIQGNTHQIDCQRRLQVRCLQIAQAYGK
jgi:hypothetical protein